MSQCFTRKLGMPEGWSHTNFYSVNPDSSLDSLIHQVRPHGDFWSEESYLESFFEFNPETDAEITLQQYIDGWKPYLKLIGKENLISR